MGKQKTIFDTIKGSKGSIALAKPNKTQKRSTDNSTKFIAERERWTEYRAMVEGIVDNVLLGMHDRNDEEKQRKVGMRAAILEILFVHTPVQQASKDENICVSTTRRYLKEVKLRLDKYFGDEAVDDEFLKQFKNYKGTVTQEHYREAMRKANKIPPEFEGKKESRKRSAANMMMGTPTNDSSTSTNPTAAKRPRTSQSNTSANAKNEGQQQPLHLMTSQQQKKKSETTIYVGNLPFNATEDDIGNHFSQCGEVINVRLIFDRETNRAKGFGFCEFRYAQGAQFAVLGLNGVDFNGRALKVDFADSK